MKLTDLLLQKSQLLLNSTISGSSGALLGGGSRAGCLLAMLVSGNAVVGDHLRRGLGHSLGGKRLGHRGGGGRLQRSHGERDAKWLDWNRDFEGSLGTTHLGMCAVCFYTLAEVVAM